VLLARLASSRLLSSPHRRSQDLFARHGDRIAQQYGGSEAMHKDALVEGKTSLTENALTALRRYYSNAVTDTEKQQAICVFLGHFVPGEGKPFIGDLDATLNHQDADKLYGNR
jgi:hypothetical protein